MSISEPAVHPIIGAFYFSSTIVVLLVSATIRSAVYYPIPSSLRCIESSWLVSAAQPAPETTGGGITGSLSYAKMSYYLGFSRSSKREPNGSA
jgi:hypothetical protein